MLCIWEVSKVSRNTFPSSCESLTLFRPGVREERKCINVKKEERVLPELGETTGGESERSSVTSLRLK